MNHSGPYFGVRNIRVWGTNDAFTAPTRVSWSGGTFVAAPDAQRLQAPNHPHPVGTDSAGRPGPEGADFDGTDLWMIPGFVDAHLHAGWQAFDESDRASIGGARTSALIAQGLRRTLDAGFTSVRDAGGLDASQASQIPETERPRLQLAGALIDRAAAERAGSLEHAVAAVLERGATWVKLVATAGVASPAGAGLEPLFTAAEIHRATTLAASTGAGLMVHAWGGLAIDYAIEAAGGDGGADVTPVSLEHGIFLTPAQAARAAQAGVTFVPTLRIYSLVQAMIAGGELPKSFGPRVREAVQAHPEAVRIARDAGLAIALGSDYGTPTQHGTGRLELDALVAAGLTPTEALVAATHGGAALLARVDPDQNQALAGRIAAGAPADAVLLRRDPREPGALADPVAVAAVILAGRMVAPASFERNPS